MACWPSYPQPLQVPDLRKYRPKLVSKGGLEPPCPKGRQPLKLVRLPFRHFDVVPGRAPYLSAVDGTLAQVSLDNHADRVLGPSVAPNSGRSRAQNHPKAAESGAFGLKWVRVRRHLGAWAARTVKRTGSSERELEVRASWLAVKWAGGEVVGRRGAGGEVVGSR